MRVAAPDLTFAGVFRGIAERGETLGVAVSGGSDSMALLHKLHLMQSPKLTVQVATVDHRLRPEASEEAAKVAAYCAARGIAHHTLVWEGWDGKGNLQDQARRARYRLLADWAGRHGVGVVALGHTADDNAETFVHGLMRGAGLDGLSGMRPEFARDGVRFVRPLLSERREGLRQWLAAHDITWSDDPSNDDTGYDRVRVRKVLADLPVDAKQLNTVIGNLRATRDGLHEDMARWAKAHVQQKAGDLIFEAMDFALLSRDTRRRFLNSALRWVSSADYAPRADKVQMLLPQPPNSPFSLHGCLVHYDGRQWRLAREPKAVAEISCDADRVWDGRWRLDGGEGAGLRIGPLGESGLRACPDWRDSGLPRASLIASPAVWQDNSLIAAPLAGNSNGWTARIVTDFHDWLVSH